MLVKDCMTRHPIMISPTTPATEAQRLMVDNNVRHLPVIGDGKRLLGLVTQENLALRPEFLGSLNVWEISRYLSNMNVQKIMTKAQHVLTVTPDTTVERTAHIMSENKASGFPVIDDGIVIGIITETDLLRALQTMLGLPSQGVRVTVRMPNRPGEFAKLTEALGRNELGVMGVGTYPTRQREGYWDTVLKIRDASTTKVEEVIGQIAEQEIIDIRDVV